MATPQNPQTFLEGIIAKRDGEELSEQFYSRFIPRIGEGLMPDYQVSAFLMAVYLRGLSEGEMLALTEAIADSGKRITFPNITLPLVDKHSTGGVGDKVSFLVGPLAAACGVAVPLTAGRGLGHTGGTTDKLESIPGIKTQLSAEEMERVLAQAGWLIAAQGAELAPADGVLYRLRDATGTVASLPLIASSIMGKKLAVENDALVLDVKFGRGAFMAQVERARELGKAMVAIARGAGRSCRALLTNMDQPMGSAVGNSLELSEAVKLLRALPGSPSDVVEVTLALGAQMLILAGIVEGEPEGRERLEEAWVKGWGYERLLALVFAQGGDVSFIEDMEKLPVAGQKTVYKAPRNGYITAMDAYQIGELARSMGAGRESMEDEIDHSVGLVFSAKVGDEVEVGEELVELHFNRGSESDYLTRIEKAVLIGDEPPEELPLILEVLK